MFNSLVEVNQIYSFKINHLLIFLLMEIRMLILLQVEQLHQIYSCKVVALNS